MYTPTLVEVGTTRPLASYRKAGVPILDQGQEGACTGFGLATVVHYLQRTRRIERDPVAVSPRMLYAMARRYDEWPGEAYEGSSCRGAMKGWHKHGVCKETLWRHDPGAPDYTLSELRSADAQSRPLGAYFRVNHKDLVAMHAALSEVGIVYASASVHSGWDDVADDGRIPDADGNLGGHAFAIVAYDREGFWIQNSWGRAWGLEGFGRIGYADWLRNGNDVWVARLGAPVVPLARSASVGASFTSSSQAKSYAYDEIRPHVISLGNEGQLRANGNIGTTAAGVRRILGEDFTRITRGWPKKRLVLYAHGGLVGEDAAVQRVAEYRRAMLAQQCYPLAFVWNSDYWSTLANMLQDAVRLRRSEGLLDSAKDFMLDRLDDALEPLARKLSGKAAWDEMKENALAATNSATGGARLAAQAIAALLATDPTIELHAVGHSAGSIFLAPLVDLLTRDRQAGGLALTIGSCTLWAPACTMGLYDSRYQPAIADARIKRFALYTLTDRAEQDDHCAHIYNKSLLYLVSHAFEAYARIPVLRPHGVALLGMARHVQAHSGLQALIDAGQVTWVQSPNTLAVGEANASASTAHGGFDDDKATVASTLRFILGDSKAAAAQTRTLQYAPLPGPNRAAGLRARLETAR
ncbi:MAG: C1 family peptidase [Gammaproteobacteria bacterium]|nr:C1 family peptidase [Gammaproteobacteria bacterium]